MPEEKEKKGIKPPRYTIVLRADVQDREKKRAYGGAATVHVHDLNVGMAKACGNLVKEFGKLPPEPPMIIKPGDAGRGKGHLN